MNTFLPEDHPRSDVGAFVDKTQSAPETALTAERTPGYPDARAIRSTVTKERYDDAYKSYKEVGRDEIDFRAIFDALPLDEVPTENDTSINDIWYEQAKDSGYAPAHDGPSTLYLDNQDLREYVEARESAGQHEPLTPFVLASPAKQHEIAGEALALAYADISVPLMAGPFSLFEKNAHRRQAAVTILAVLEGSRIDFEGDTLSDGDKSQIAKIVEVEDAPSQLTHLTLLMHSAQMADYLLTRGAYVEKVQS